MILQDLTLFFYFCFLKIICQNPAYAHISELSVFPLYSLLSLPAFCISLLTFLLQERPDPLIARKDLVIVKSCFCITDSPMALLYVGDLLNIKKKNASGLIYNCQQVK